MSGLSSILRSLTESMHTFAFGGSENETCPLWFNSIKDGIHDVVCVCIFKPAVSWWHLTSSLRSGIFQVLFIHSFICPTVARLSASYLTVLRPAHLSPVLSFIPSINNIPPSLLFDGLCVSFHLPFPTHICPVNLPAACVFTMLDLFTCLDRWTVSLSTDFHSSKSSNYFFFVWIQLALPAWVCI